MKKEHSIQQRIKNHYLQGRPLSTLSEKEKRLLDYYLLVARISERLTQEQTMEKLPKE